MHIYIYNVYTAIIFGFLAAIGETIMISLRQAVRRDRERQLFGKLILYTTTTPTTTTTT